MPGSSIAYFMLSFTVLEQFCPVELSMMMEMFCISALSVMVATNHTQLLSTRKCGKYEWVSKFSVVLNFFCSFIKIYFTTVKYIYLQFSRFQYIYRLVQPLPQSNFITFSTLQKGKPVCTHSPFLLSAPSLWQLLIYFLFLDLPLLAISWMNYIGCDCLWLASFT